MPHRSPRASGSRRRSESAGSGGRAASGRRSSGWTRCSTKLPRPSRRPAELGNRRRSSRCLPAPSEPPTCRSHRRSSSGRCWWGSIRVACSPRDMPTGWSGSASHSTTWFPRASRRWVSSPGLGAVLRTVCQRRVVRRSEACVSPGASVLTESNPSLGNSRSVLTTRQIPQGVSTPPTRLSPTNCHGAYWVAAKAARLVPGGDARPGTWCLACAWARVARSNGRTHDET